MLKIFWGLVASVLALPLLAQAQPPSQSLSLTPFIFEERLEKGQTIQRQIELSNTSQEPLTITTEVSGFSSGSGNGQPIFAPNDQALSSPYNLSSWLTVTQPPAKVLLPGNHSVVTVTINVPPNAEEGSRYGGVLFSYSSQKGQENGAVIVKKTACLFFVRVGTANEQGSIAQYSVRHQIFSTSAVTFRTMFANTGNVHLKPKGLVHIYNSFGQLVATAPVNRDAQIVLPQTQRQFESSWQPRLALGHYTAELTYYFGENNYEAKAKVSFWVLPLAHIAAGLIILALIILGAVTAVKYYNARVLAKAGMKPRHRT